MPASLCGAAAVQAVAGPDPTGPCRLRDGGRHERVLGAVASDRRARAGGRQRRPGACAPRAGSRRGARRACGAPRAGRRPHPTWSASTAPRARPRPKRPGRDRSFCARSMSTQPSPEVILMAAVDHDTRVGWLNPAAVDGDPRLDNLLDEAAERKLRGVVWTGASGRPGSASSTPVRTLRRQREPARGRGRQGPCHEQRPRLHAGDQRRPARTPAAGAIGPPSRACHESRTPDRNEPLPPHGGVHTIPGSRSTLRPFFGVRIRCRRESPGGQLDGASAAHTAHRHHPC